MTLSLERGTQRPVIGTGLIAFSGIAGLVAQRGTPGLTARRRSRHFIFDLWNL